MGWGLKYIRYLKYEGGAAEGAAPLLRIKAARFHLRGTGPESCTENYLATAPSEKM